MTTMMIEFLIQGGFDTTSLTARLALSLAESRLRSRIAYSNSYTRLGMAVKKFEGTQEVIGLQVAFAANGLSIFCPELAEDPAAFVNSYKQAVQLMYGLFGASH